MFSAIRPNFQFYNDPCGQHLTSTKALSNGLPERLAAYPLWLDSKPSLDEENISEMQLGTRVLFPVAEYPGEDSIFPMLTLPPTFFSERIHLALCPALGYSLNLNLVSFSNSACLDPKCPDFFSFIKRSLYAREYFSFSKWTLFQ